MVLLLFSAPACSPLRFPPRTFDIFMVYVLRGVCVHSVASSAASSIVIPSLFDISHILTVVNARDQMRMLYPGRPHAFFFDTLEENRYYTVTLDGVENGDARTGAFTTLKVCIY